MINDQTLWQGLKLGDREMFLALYQKYYHPLLFIGLKQIKDSQLVKDTIHQLFLYLWEKKETIQVARDIKSYLITSFLRKLTADAKRLKRTELLETWHRNSEDNQFNPEEKLVIKDQQGHIVSLLMKKINELPARHRELIVLKFYEGLDYDEIVERTGLSYRTVYNKIYEGVKKLKSEMIKAPVLQLSNF